MKKISLSNVKNALDRDELRAIKGGSAWCVYSGCDVCPQNCSTPSRCAWYCGAHTTGDINCAGCP
jgi:natural product precursor